LTEGCLCASFRAPLHFIIKYHWFSMWFNKFQVVEEMAVCYWAFSSMAVDASNNNNCEHICTQNGVTSAGRSFCY
jgi:hypothetical protein